ncbi:MAG: hypothetical protein ACTHNQ_05885 [Microbacterium sp.]|uniref:hypothetical protein n=1 Tax=Microbacterium sp. TaxID=51671 RepID=UPI00037B1555
MNATRVIRRTVVAAVGVAVAMVLAAGAITAVAASSGDDRHAGGSARVSMLFQ